ncbi:MAG: YncE family protein [Nitrososphaeraceae archaeon]
MNSALLGDVEVGTEPVDLLFNPSNNNMYVANIVSNSVFILDSGNNTVVSTVNVNSLPLALEVDPFKNRVYVTGTLTGAEDLVSVIG